MNNTAKTFYILAISLNIVHNYFIILVYENYFHICILN